MITDLAKRRRDMTRHAQPCNFYSIRKARDDFNLKKATYNKELILLVKNN